MNGVSATRQSLYRYYDNLIGNKNNFVWAGAGEQIFLIRNADTPLIVRFADDVPTSGGGAPVLFNNELSDRFEDELRLADSLRVRPIQVGEQGWERELERLINDPSSTGMIKWAVDENGNLLIIPHGVSSSGGVVEINHTVLTQGNPVLAAGEVNLAGFNGQFFGIEINRHSGHYMPSEESLVIGADLFRQFGIEFRIINGSLD